MKNDKIIDRFQHEIEHYSWIESELADPRTAADPARFKELSRQHSRQNLRVEKMKQFLALYARLSEAESILKDPVDPELAEIAEQEKEELSARLTAERSEIEELLLPPDANDGRALIFEIRAGTGGEEAALFAAELFRMYLRYSEKIGLRTELMYMHEAEMGGLKEVSFSVSGDQAYRLLHQEAGTHRVQRIPTTESGGRIHTSAVTVAVLVEAEEEEVEIQDQDLQIDVYRASGAGGQHVNKTESAVRITHIPTGLVVTCQDERSQLKNKARAMKVLRSRLAAAQKEKAHAAASETKKQQVGSGDRSEKIRTYNFPQGRITDHRINFSVYNLAEFMNGEMGSMLQALADHEREERMQQVQV
ncbi:MAG: peptide chain release factor 1 [Spirochaetales bacterium]|nr:peptide chain release factor 1 [Spirochaetales bacterium]